MTWSVFICYGMLISELNPTLPWCTRYCCTYELSNESICQVPLPSGNIIDSINIDIKITPILPSSWFSFSQSRYPPPSGHLILRELGDEMIEVDRYRGVRHYSCPAAPAKLRGSLSFSKVPTAPVARSLAPQLSTTLSAVEHSASPFLSASAHLLSPAS